MGKPKDSKYRDIIAQELDRSILVEAGAGSGKTRSLVDRMLALIGAGKCTADKMAGVTFTRKAASELKARFQIGLENAFKSEKDEEKRARYQAALTKLEMVFAGTIHSFCARLLRERPVEAGLDPDFQELEEEEDAILRDQCWSEYIESLHADEAPILTEIIELGLDPDKLVSTYQSMTLYAEVEAMRYKQQRPDFKKEKKLLKAYLEQAWEALPKNVPENGWDDLQFALRVAKLQMRNPQADEDINFIKILSGLDGNRGITQYKWRTKDIAKDQKKIFDKFREDVITPCLERWRSYCHYFIMELVVPAVEYYKKVRERNSRMNYNDLLLKAAELLRENPEVRRYFQERYPHILVDEFQDTDPIQAEVILYLTSQDLKERSWRNIKVKPGSLFVVGDPKQSIYRFRRADIDTYNEVKKIVKESGGRIIPLTTNFRSLPAICDWVNPVFMAKFPPQANQYQPEYEPLEPYKTFKNNGIKRITIDRVYRHSQVEIARQDAERIASFIGWALKGNFKC